MKRSAYQMSQRGSSMVLYWDTPSSDQVHSAEESTFLGVVASGKCSDRLFPHLSVTIASVGIWVLLSHDINAPV